MTDSNERSVIHTLYKQQNMHLSQLCAIVLFKTIWKINKLHMLLTIHIAFNYPHWSLEADY